MMEPLSEPPVCGVNVAATVQVPVTATGVVVLQVVDGSKVKFVEDVPRAEMVRGAFPSFSKPVD